MEVQQNTNGDTPSMILRQTNLHGQLNFQNYFTKNESSVSGSGCHFINICQTKSDTVMIIQFSDRQVWANSVSLPTVCIFWIYRKFPKYSDTQKICCNHSKIWTMWLYHRVMSPNDADGMANSVDPDQTAPDLGLHCLFRHICPKT